MARREGNREEQKGWKAGKAGTGREGMETLRTPKEAHAQTKADVKFVYCIVFLRLTYI